MILPYALRLAVLASAAAFLINAAFTLAAWAASRWTLRRAGRLPAHTAARLLLWLRLLPAGAASVGVGLWCVPGYFWLEQPGPERVGPACLIAAVLGAAVMGAAGLRACAALARSARCWQEWRAAGSLELLPGEPVPIWVVDTPRPLVAAAGLVRPRTVVGRSVASALEPAELAAALRHERAHSDSRDNLKRLAVMLAPPLLPGCAVLRPLERAWLTFAEWAADDRAAAGGPPEALSLAAALLRLARMQAGPSLPSLATSLLESSDGLASRVERLLAGSPLPEPRAVRATPLTVLVLLWATLLVAQPAVLRWAHGWLERLAG